MNPAVADPAPRSTAVTVLAWVVVVLSVLLLPISVISGLMVLARSHGTASTTLIGFCVVVLGLPTMLVAGIGLLRRRKWALIHLVLVLGGIVIVNALNLASEPPTTTTYKSPGGTTTTVTSAGRNYVMGRTILIVISVASLTILLSRRVRAEFGFGSGQFAPDTPPVIRPPTEAVDRERGWRVGHRGRDNMVYEEWREGAWQLIEIRGEMLMGRAQHVIYFAPPQRWLEYSEWARHRRDEIIARIKSEFRPPDYEYGDDLPRAAPPVVGITAAQPRQLKPNIALLIAVIVLLAVTAGTGWLVGNGLNSGETFLPSMRATQRRVVVRKEEPVTFWISLGLYAALGVGALGGAGWLLRAGMARKHQSPTK